MDIKKLIVPNDSKIVFYIADGLGGLPHPDFEFKTELEYAKTPNLDALAKKSVLGRTIPVRHGITPGSGPAHFGLFGYDPASFEVGRGVLEALGVNFPLKKGDVAIRCNFATLDSDGKILDRRAGRIPTEEAIPVIEKIKKAIGGKIEDVEIFVFPVKEYRFGVVLRGEGLSDCIPDTDPQKVGVKPLPVKATCEEGKKTERILARFVEIAHESIKDEKRANGFLLRGISELPEIEPFPEKFKLKSLALANYPMYKGLARLVGMDTPEAGSEFKDLIAMLKEKWNDYDFFFVHYKWTDKAGEDGDFLKKVHYIEEFDSYLKDVLSLEPDVLVITGDHSTPALWKGHSWHPSPLLLYSKVAGADSAERFTERECKHGYLGMIYAFDLMPIVLANAGRLKKYGA